MNAVESERIHADIHDIVKTHTDLIAILTDRDGKVLFDSEAKHSNADFSRWRDIHRAILGIRFPLHPGEAR
ncbi:MAG: hypothetical protein MZU95_10725 [Desulfomicrobium escambiense]|nr:hypothetical protein [Desulfomicrobium escambiense]